MPTHQNIGTFSRLWEIQINKLAFSQGTILSATPNLNTVPYIRTISSESHSSKKSRTCTVPSSAISHHNLKKPWSLLLLILLHWNRLRQRLLLTLNIINYSNSCIQPNVAYGPTIEQEIAIIVCILPITVLQVDIILLGKDFDLSFWATCRLFIFWRNVMMVLSY